jgi:hypothetical protein
MSETASTFADKIDRAVQRVTPLAWRLRRRGRLWMRRAMRKPPEKLARWTSRAVCFVLAFGLYWHYMAESPDNVFHLHEGALQSLFSTTALLLVASEVCGVLVGCWGILKSQKS